MTDHFTNQFQKIEKNLSSERGEFELFALFLREDSSDKWDLLVSAPWIKHEGSTELRDIAQKIQSSLNKEELLKLSRIILVDRKNPMLETFNRAIHAEHTITEVKDSNFFGLPIKHAYIFTSKRILVNWSARKMPIRVGKFMHVLYKASLMI